MLIWSERGIKMGILYDSEGIDVGECLLMVSELKMKQMRRNMDGDYQPKILKLEMLKRNAVRE